MSFNNHLAFNISKSTPTTSTNNTNTTSTKSLKSDGENLDKKGFKVSSSPPIQLETPSSPRPVLNILKKNLESTSSVTQPVLTRDEGVKSLPNKSDSRTDLIDLFDKFDVKKDNIIEKQDDSEKHESYEEDQETKLEKMSSAVEDEDEHQSRQPQTIERRTQSHVNIGMQPYNPNFDKSKPKDEQLIDLDDNNAHIHDVETRINKNTNQDKIQESIPNAPDANQESNQEESKSEPRDLNHKLDKDNISDASRDKVDSLKSRYPERTHERVRSDGEIVDIIGNTAEQSAVEEFQVEPVSDPLQGRPKLESRNSKFKINSTEQHQQSHRPFDFQNFLAQLRKKNADPIVRYIRSFLASYIKQGHTFTAEQRIKIIKDFKIFMNEKFSLYEPFSSMDSIDLENSREGLEKLIMNRVHDLCFPPNIIKSSPNVYIPEPFQNDLNRDKEFVKKLQEYHWIQGEHLDIDTSELVSIKVKDDVTFLDYAIKELKKIDDFRAPRDKIICILNSCKIIFSFLKLTKKETNADSFMPILILVLIKSNIEDVHSNISYIKNFRGSEWLLHGETSYYMASIEGAVSFIENLTTDDIALTKEDEQNLNTLKEIFIEIDHDILKQKLISNKGDLNEACIELSNF